MRLQLTSFAHFIAPLSLCGVQNERRRRWVHKSHKGRAGCPNSISALRSDRMSMIAVTCSVQIIHWLPSRRSVSDGFVRLVRRGSLGTLSFFGLIQTFNKI